MNDLISRQAAIDALAKFVPYAICDESTESYTNGLTDAYNLILQLPSAQPEIIRCKDCKHWEKNDWNPNGMCNAFDDGSVCVLTETNSDEYCSKAERKDK